MSKKGENIYKRKDGRYEGRYIKGRKLDGKPLFGYIYARTYSEVKSKLTLAKAIYVNKPNLRFVGKGSLAEFIQYWLDNAAAGRLKPSTYSRYHERISSYITPALGLLPMSKITCEHVQDFADSLARKGLAPSTISGIIGVLRSVMHKACEMELILTNPCVSICLPKPEPKRRSVLDRAEQIKLEKIAVNADESVCLGIFLSLYTGMRIGELCALRRRDIDFSANTITVRGTLQRIKNLGEGESKTTIIETVPKSKNSLRIIPMPTPISDMLSRRCLKARAEDYVLSGSSARIEPRILRSRFGKLADKAGLDINFHALRHTYATRCLENNFDIQTLSELLGHSSAAITMQIYAHSVLEHKKLLVDRIQILSQIQ